MLKPPHTLLLGIPATAKAKLIVRADDKVISSLCDTEIVRSSVPKQIKRFDISDIRINSDVEVISDSEKRTLLTKKLVLDKSILASVLMFLALSWKYGQANRVVLVTRQTPAFIEKLCDDLRMFYPKIDVVVVAKAKMDEIYESFAQGVVTPDESPAPTYLLSLGTTPVNHVAMVKHFRPKHALMGISTDVDCPINFKFYDGEMWIPPFGGAVTQVTYIRKTFKTSELDVDPTISGIMWNGSTIASALLKFRFVTNESVGYLNPATGTPTYLFEKYPNDYAHMFAYTAVYYFYKKCGTWPPINQFQAAFESIVPHKD